MHQKRLPLATTQCLRPGVPAARERSYALVDHFTVAMPEQRCGASLLHVKDLALHFAHHHPLSVLHRVCPPLAGFLATTEVLLPVCGLMPGACCTGLDWFLSFLFSAATTATRTLDACVSLPGSPHWRLARIVALAIHMAF